MTDKSFRHLSFAQIDSTNAEARRLAEKGDTGPLWITAKVQTAGRGRRGRDWVSDSGNLFVTHLLALPVNHATAAQLSFVTALAVHDASKLLLENDKALSLKWPNDVLLDGKKLAGILLETLPETETGMINLAIGCGVNLDHAPAETSYPATWLNAHRQTPVSPEAFLPLLVNKMSNWMDVWQIGTRFDRIAKAWQERASHVGKTITLQTAGNAVTGRFLRLADNGALVLELPDKTQQQFHAGDVSFHPQSNKPES